MAQSQEKPAIFVFTTAYDPFIGGAEIAIKEVVKRLSNEFRFFIFTSRFRLSLPKLEEKDGVVIRRIGLGFSFDKFIVPALGFFVVRWYAAKYRPSAFWAVMATYASGIPYLINMFTLRKPVPVILTLQEGDPVEHIQKAKLGLIRISWRAALKRTDHLTAISTFLLNLAKDLGYRGKASVIPNGVDVSAFTRDFMPDELRLLKEGLRIDSDEKVVITTSRLVEKNAVDTAIRSIGVLNRKGRRVKFLVIGSGEDEKTLKELARKEGVGERVIFLGQIPHAEIPKYLKIADVFVRPSRSEGFGNSFIEAMAAGVPIIGTMVGGITDFLEDGKTGVAVRVDDSLNLAEAIIRVMDDAALCERLTAEGRRVSLTRFQWDMIAQDYASAFRGVIKDSAMPRILIATGIFPPDIGGPATYSKILADELPKHGFGVSVLNFGVFRHLPKGIRHAGYFWNVLRQARYTDAIFAQDPVSVGLPAAIAAKILGKKFVLKIVGDYAWEQGMQRFGVPDLLDEFLRKHYGFRVEFLRKIQKFSARAAHVIIVPSNYLKGVVVKWGIPEDKIRVIYNAFEGENSPLHSHEEARRDLGLSGSVAISVGRLVPWKGFMTLIGIIPEIVKSIPDFKLVIVGSGPEEERIRSEVNKLGLSERVRLVGQVAHDRLLVYLKAADVFVLNTAYEGFSHTLLEAMAVGIPAVTTSVGGNTEVIESGVNGILVPYDDRQELKRAIVELCKNMELKRALVSNALKSLDKFSKEKTVEDTIMSLFHL
ncbi:MAG: glycosyltransferase [Candidatus Sungiibacteriota bacterium]